MTDTSVPATATEARALLDARISDKAFGERFLNGDAAARAEISALHEKIAAGGDDVVESVIKGIAPEASPDGILPNAEHRQMVSTVEMFRELGIRDEVTRQFLKGEGVTAAEYELVSNWKKMAMGSKDFRDRYLSGDSDARQRMMLADSVLVNGIKESGAAA
jgi:hypothetical protein